MKKTVSVIVEFYDSENNLEFDAEIDTQLDIPEQVRPLVIGKLPAADQRRGSSRSAEAIWNNFVDAHKIKSVKIKGVIYEFCHAFVDEIDDIELDLEGI